MRWNVVAAIWAMVFVGAMARGQELRGRVVDESGKGVAGLGVQITTYGARVGGVRGSGPVNKKLVTDEEGRFTWSWPVAKGDYVMMAIQTPRGRRIVGVQGQMVMGMEQVRLTEADLERLQAGTYELRLCKTREVRGKVKRLPGGSGEGLEVRWVLAGRTSEGSGMGRSGFVDVSKDGSFVLKDVPSMGAALEVDVPGRTRVVAEVPDARGVSANGGDATGGDANGVEATEVEVDAESVRPGYRMVTVTMKQKGGGVLDWVVVNVYREEEGASEAVADEGGKLRVEVKEAKAGEKTDGSWAVVLSLDMGQGAYRRVTVPAGVETYEAEFVAPRYLEVRVVDAETGKPVENFTGEVVPSGTEAHVAMNSPWGSIRQWSIDLSQLSGDGNRLLVWLEAPGYVPVGTVVETPEKVVKDGVTVRMKRGKPVKVRVVDDKGKVATNVAVGRWVKGHVEPKTTVFDFGQGERSLWQAKTDGSGVAEVWPVEGKFQVWAKGEAGWTVTEEMEAGDWGGDRGGDAEKVLEVKLRPYATAKGKLEGKIPEGVKLYVVMHLVPCERSDAYYGTTENEEIEVEDDGTFEIGGLMDGKYRVFMKVRKGENSWSSEEVGSFEAKEGVGPAKFVVNPQVYRPTSLSAGGDGGK